MFYFMELVTIWLHWFDPVGMVTNIQYILQQWSNMRSSMYHMPTNYRRTLHVMVRLVKLVKNLQSLNI